jgi:hypothetical protein
MVLIIGVWTIVAGIAAAWVLLAYQHFENRARARGFLFQGSTVILATGILFAIVVSVYVLGRGGGDNDGQAALVPTPSSTGLSRPTATPRESVNPIQTATETVSVSTSSQPSPSVLVPTPASTVGGDTLTPAPDASQTPRAPSSWTEGFNGQTDIAHWGEPTEPDLMFVQNGQLKIRVRAEDSLSGSASSYLDAKIENENVSSVSFDFGLADVIGNGAGGLGVYITLSDDREAYMDVGPSAGQPSVEIPYLDFVCGSAFSCTTVDGPPVSIGQLVKGQILLTTSEIGMYADGVKYLSMPTSGARIAKLQIFINGDPGSAFSGWLDNVSVSD